MAVKPRPDDVKSEIVINPISQKEIEFYIVGVTPLVVHAMSQKGIQDLLFPPAKKSKTERASSLKHKPYEEYRDAMYVFRDEDDEPTRLYLPGSAFHSSVGSAAIDMAGASKAQVGRLTSVDASKVAVWGIPQIGMFIPRSSDIARTPDIRMLPVLKRWATKVTFTFVDNIIKHQSLANLLGGAGQIVGVGDGRPHKGKLAFGKWRVAAADDPEFLDIVASGGRAFQDAAIANPTSLDVETDRVLRWFDEEVKRRHAKPVRQDDDEDGEGDRQAA